jgi:hypothetical protein
LPHIGELEEREPWMAQSEPQAPALYRLD